MCELQWSALAEFRLHNNDFPKEIYCLCSRVFACFTPNENITLGLSASEEDNLNQEQTHSSDNVYDDAHESSDTIKYCTKGEPVSCYCSASHTDNISTDEHDSLRDSHGSHQQAATKSLQLSDSGADLTEDISYTNSAWKKYWALNGERLIWKSWIAKYSAYINPEYLETIQAYSEDLSNKEDADINLKYSFNATNPPQDCCDCSTSLDQGISLLQVTEIPEHRTNEVHERNRMLIRNLSYSDSYDKLNREIEGWNPLSPVSNDCETEAERLLSSRCASRTGSSARTIDSMTNVTHLTVSSLDLSQSSKNSDSFSSVSSIHSSITSTSSEEADDTADYEQQWNILWTKHYEQEYLEHYKRFILENSAKQVESMMECLENFYCDTNEYPNENTTPNELQAEINQSSNEEELPLARKTKKRNTKKQRRKQRKSINPVDYLVESSNETELVKLDMNVNLPTNPSSENVTNKDEVRKHTMVVDLPVSFSDQADENRKCDCSLDAKKSTDLPHDGNSTIVKEPSKQSEANENGKLDCILNEEKSVDLPPDGKSITEMENQNDTVAVQSIQTEDVEYVDSLENKEAMIALGIPLKFGCKPRTKPNYSKKRSFRNDSDQSSSDRIKAAFNLLKVEMYEGQKKRFKGSVEYKRKNIKSQNRNIYFHYSNDKYSKAIQPKHIHFDDDGEVIPEIGQSKHIHFDDNGKVIPTSIKSRAENDEGSEQDSDHDELSDSSDHTEENEDSSVNWEDNKDIRKFYNRRYSLFSKFDEGIKLDRESWFSVTPEQIAKHTAERCQCDIIIDAFCGAGGNTIQFAKTCRKVIAIDIDPQKVELARHNAGIYGVEDRIQFIVGDFFELASTLEADVIFLSPPWGGPQYKRHRRYDLQRLQPKPFDDLWTAARRITPNLAFYLPKNSNTYPLLIAPSSDRVELEQNILGGFLIAITAYYGNLVKKPTTQEEIEGR